MIWYSPNIIIIITIIGNSSSSIGGYSVLDRRDRTVARRGVNELALGGGLLVYGRIAVTPWIQLIAFDNNNYVLCNS